MLLAVFLAINETLCGSPSVALNFAAADGNFWTLAHFLPRDKEVHHVIRRIYTCGRAAH
jgi:hypothetical protein